jgi:biopolymer transport protein ExbD
MSGISFRKPRARKQVDLNVTSLVDVLFLLLIFFTLTSTFKRAGEIELQLPKSTTGEHTASGTGNQPVDLVLTENGTLLLDGSPTTFDALPPRLRSVHDRQPDRQVMIEAGSVLGTARSCGCWTPCARLDSWAWASGCAPPRPRPPNARVREAPIRRHGLAMGAVACKESTGVRRMEA